MNYSDFQFLQFDHKPNGILLITINRPEVMNATNARLHWELTKVWGVANDDVKTKVVVITGAGDKAFSAGGDLKRMLQQAGFDVTLEVVDQPSLIATAIGGDYQLASFRNQPGGDPDINYPWWFGNGNPVNFGRFDDPEINDLFTDARSNPDPKVREADYQKITRRMVTQHYNVYLFYTRWAVAEASNVHGILGPPLPNKHEPPPRLVTDHSMAGIWIEPRT